MSQQKHEESANVKEKVKETFERTEMDKNQYKSRKNNKPWLTKKIVQAMKRRNMYYKRAKLSLNFTKYKCQRNKVTSMLKEAKRNFFERINPHHPKEFWKACKMLSGSPTSIPTLQTSSDTAQTNDEKAQLLNKFFVSCFNASCTPLNNNDFLSIQCPDTIPENILCDEDHVLPP